MDRVLTIPPSTTTSAPTKGGAKKRKFAVPDDGPPFTTAGSGGRVTRRSVNAPPAAHAFEENAGGYSSGSGIVDDEMSREAAHMDWSGISGGADGLPKKRAKKPFDIDSCLTAVIGSSASSASPEAYPSASSADRLGQTQRDNPTFYPARQPIPSRPYAYPVGMTPFRYPCLHPHDPPPPPGDPLSAKWKPFDPNHVSHLLPLPASVRALSVFGQSMLARSAREAAAGVRSGSAHQMSARTATASAGRSAGPKTMSQASITRSSGRHMRQSQKSVAAAEPSVSPSTHESEWHDVQALMPPSTMPLDPALQFAHLPPIDPLMYPATTTSEPPSGAPAATSLPAEDTAGFDINSFFDSATYETISALLAAGDPVASDPNTALSATIEYRG